MQNPHINAALIRTKTQDLTRAVVNDALVRQPGTCARGSAQRRGPLRYFPPPRAATKTPHPRPQA